MSETVLFGVGSAVFAVTVYGSVMAGGFWFKRIQDAEAEGSADDEGRPPRV